MIALVAIVLALSACSSKNTGSTSSAKRENGVATFGTAEGPVDALRWGLPYGEPSSLDPPNTAYFSSALVAGNLCDPLLRLNSDFSIAPNLASYEQVDPKTVVFTLREGVTFWDGSPVTADDVVWSLDHARGPESSVAFLFVAVSAVEKTGPSEVTVRFTRPDALFLKEVASFSGSIQQKAFSEKAGKELGTSAGGLMCSGPYKLVKWTPGSKIELARNDTYWNTEAKAHAKTVELTFNSDSTSLAQALVSGELDGAYEVAASTIPRLKKATSSGNLVFGSPSQLFLSLSPAQTTGALAEADVRKALWMTIDRKALASVVYHGAAEPNYTYTNKDSWNNGSVPAAAQKIWSDAYDGFVKERSTWGSASAIAEAKKIVAASGQGDAPIVMAVPAGDSTLAQVGQLIQASAAQAGLKVTIKALQSIQYSNAIYDPEARVGIDLLLSTSFNVAPDPQEMVNFGFLPDSPYNYVGYDDPTVTKLLTDANSSLDPVERATLGTEAQAIYEQFQGSQVLLQLNEVSFFKKGLGGATTSFAYLNQPSLAQIGSDD